MNCIKNRSLHVARESMKASGTVDVSLTNERINEIATNSLGVIQTWILANEYPRISKKDNVPTNIDVDKAIEIYLRGIEGNDIETTDEERDLVVAAILLAESLESYSYTPRREFASRKLNGQENRTAQSVQRTYFIYKQVLSRTNTHLFQIPLCDDAKKLLSIFQLRDE